MTDDPETTDDTPPPFQPPPGVGDPRPVLAETHRAAINALRSLASVVSQMAISVERDPWSDVMVDVLGPAFETGCEVAAQRLAIFRHTRDCEGQA